MQRLVPHCARPIPRHGLARARRAALRLAVPAVALACDGEISGVGGATGSTVATGGSSVATTASLDPALFGVWRRTLYFQGVDGSTNSSETSWRFSPDGFAVRTVVARNLTFGYADAVHAVALWRVEAGAVVLTFQPPDAGTVRFAYAVDRVGGGVLVLGRERYARVGA